jgi:hypothetical protein
MPVTIGQVNIMCPEHSFTTGTNPSPAFRSRAYAHQRHARNNLVAVRYSARRMLQLDSLITESMPTNSMASKS